MYDGEEVKIYGRKFLANVALPENSPGGLFLVNRDPRSQRRKPDVYVGVVEEVGEDCLFVKPGDKVCFKRWEWQQLNIDSERMVAREEDLVILANETPAPGVIVVKLIQNKLVTTLALPDTLRAVRSAPTLKGEVIAHSPYLMGHLKGKILKGDILFFEKSKDEQWSFSDGRVALKVCRYFDIFMIAKKCEACGDACFKHKE